MEVIVEETGTGKFQQTVIMGDHTSKADEPKASGGDDIGPSPYDFLLASLGTCTSMTLRLYADFKKIPLEKVTVKLSIEKNHAKDCENCEKDSRSRLDHIICTIELKGNLTDEARKHLLEIAKKCPVHRTLTSPIIISSQIV